MACSGSRAIILMILRDKERVADLPGSINKIMVLHPTSFLVVESMFSPMCSLSIQFHIMIYCIATPER